MNRGYLTYCFSFLFLWSLGPIWAQDEKDSAVINEDLGTVNNVFQEHFFEALKQKGIENYELALTALRKAELASKKATGGLAVIYFERGKNLYQLKRYDEAEDAFKNTLEITGDKMDVLEALYEVYYKKNAYSEAIEIVEKLVQEDADFKEQLANLYLRDKQYDKALSVLDDLDASWGENAYRNALRKQIYKATGNTEKVIIDIESKLASNPKNEKEYLNLIYLYSEQGNTKKAFETAKALLKNNPKSEKVHIALYKFYLEQGKTQEAIQSLETVFNSLQIPGETKYKALEDFVDFVTLNSQYESALTRISQNFNEGPFLNLLGTYYSAKGEKEKALGYFSKGVKNDPDNFNLIKNTILLQIDTQKFDQAAQLSEEALAFFPAQALLYLLNGVANNELSNYQNAIDSLEMGVDFILEDPKMERDFYLQLSKAYQGKGDAKKATEYQMKAQKVQVIN